MAKRIRVIIADDRFRSRSALRALLATQPAIEVIAEAADGNEAIQMVQESHPDILVMDICMPLMDGLTATRYIKRTWPEVKIVLLTMYSTIHQEAMDAGADIFLVKGGPPQDLIDAIIQPGQPARPH
jgi:DNA-binding NarL/FixJ family response regulator